MGLRSKVRKRVYALADEMKTSRLPLIVEVLKLDSPFAKNPVSDRELIQRDTPLIDKLDPSNELAEMSVVRFRQ